MKLSSRKWFNPLAMVRNLEGWSFSFSFSYCQYLQPTGFRRSCVGKMKNGFLSATGPCATFLSSGHINYGHPIEPQVTALGWQRPLISSNSSNENNALRL